MLCSRFALVLAGLAALSSAGSAAEHWVYLGVYTGKGAADSKGIYRSKFDDATGNYTQTVSVNDAVVATLSTRDGHAQGWGSAVECGAEDCGTMPAHSE